MKRIAVVEDEVYMREELCNMLQKDGYLAEAITELEDAVRLLAALRPDLNYFWKSKIWQESAMTRLRLQRQSDCIRLLQENICSNAGHSKRKN